MTSTGGVHEQEACVAQLRRDHCIAWLTALERVPGLTPREREVFLLLVTGESNQQLAATLMVSERTIKSHVAHIIAKLGLSSRLQACLASHAYWQEIAPKDDRPPRSDGPC